MVLFLAALAAGVAAGAGTGGRIRHVADVRLRAAPLAWVAVGMQASLGLPPTRHLGGGRTALVVVSFGLVGAFLLLNLRGHTGALRTGMVLLAAGWALNTAVVTANGGMPVSHNALRQSGLPVDLDVREGNLWKHVPASSSTRLAPLGDVIVVDGVPNVFSVGDLVLMAGITVATAAAMRRRPATVEVHDGSAATVAA